MRDALRLKMIIIMIIVVVITSLTLSLRREGGCCNSPFGFSLVPFLLRLPYSQFTHPLSRYPCIYEKIFQKFLPWKKLGGRGGGGCDNLPVLRGKGWQQK